MSAMTIDEAQRRLRDVLAGMQPGEEVALTDGIHTVARLVAANGPAKRPRQPGSAVGILKIVSDDDEHLDDFKDYMP